MEGLHKSCDGKSLKGDSRVFRADAPDELGLASDPQGQVPKRETTTIGAHSPRTSGHGCYEIELTRMLFVV
jgi:hypothetical protein